MMTMVFRRLVQEIRVTGRVAACDARVRVLILRDFTTELHVFIAATWPWVLFGESLHRYTSGQDSSMAQTTGS
jgi:hypothetical protein